MMAFVRTYLSWFLIIVAVPTFVTACSDTKSEHFSQLSTVDQAAVTADRLGYAFIGFHETYTSFYGIASPGTKTVLREKVNPLVNKAQVAVALYIEAVATWKKTSEKPENIAYLLENANKLYDEAIEAFRQIAKSSPSVQ